MSKRRYRKKLQGEFEAHVTHLSHEGRGMSAIEGKTLFLGNALPDETVMFRYEKHHRQYDEGLVTNVLQANPDRVEPKCQSFTVCGGCSLQHMQPSKQLAHKQQTLIEQLKHIGKTEAEVIIPPLTGPFWQYRTKARLGVKHVRKKEKVLVGFRERDGRYVADMDTCEILVPEIGQQLTVIAALIEQMDAKESIPQIEVAAGEDQVALIFRHLEDLSDRDTELLKNFEQAHQFAIFLQPGGPDSVQLLSQRPDEFLRYSHPEYQIEYLFHPSDFTQVNVDINQQMVTLAMELLDLKKTDRVLDLFCGLGNFTLPMARFADEVVGIEGSQMMVDRAAMNAKHNGITNTTFFADDLSLEQSELLKTLGAFDKVLIDPPRTGALSIIQQLQAYNIPRIVYVSCNPATLARDTFELVHHQGYKLLKTGVMDMFPHTAHVESIAVFEKSS